MCYQCWNKSFPPELQDREPSLWEWLRSLIKART
jgi:hypothetical protein